MATKIIVKNGTRQQLDLAATNDLLNEGEPYLITGENRIAVGTSTNAYETFIKESELGIVKNTAAALFSNMTTIDVSIAKHFIVTVVNTDAITINFSNWGASGYTGMVMVEIINGGLSLGINFPPEVRYILQDGTTTPYFQDLNATLSSTGGSDFFMFWSRDQGNIISARLMR